MDPRDHPEFFSWKWTLLSVAYALAWLALGYVIFAANNA